jgi:hypothetical protein
VKNTQGVPVIYRSCDQVRRDSRVSRVSRGCRATKKEEEKMGQVTTARIEDWQRRHGIEAAQGEPLQRLERISALAVDLVKAVELERSGIRGGDGYWHGSDPVTGIIEMLVKESHQ